MKRRPIEQRTCMCGKILGSRGWYTRHRRKCEVWLNSTEHQVMVHMQRAFAPTLVRSIITTTPLLNALLKRLPKQSRRTNPK